MRSFRWLLPLVALFAFTPSSHAGVFNYGFGYIGEGYHGGYWNHGTFV